MLTSNAFNRGGEPFNGLSPDGTAALGGFAFSFKDGSVMDAPLRTPEGWDVIQLKQHKTATREEFDKDREAFVQQLVGAKRDEALSMYVKRLREQAKDDIKIEESYVQEAKVDGGTSTSDEEEEY
jgi:parvulin-like peptidyl-prolyl isomerase